MDLRIGCRLETGRRSESYKYTVLLSGFYIARLVIGTSRTIGSAKKFVRITSGFGGGEFT